MSNGLTPYVTEPYEEITPRQRHTGMNESQSNRIQNLEMRSTQAEQSNRSLVNQAISMDDYLTNTIQKLDEDLRNEKLWQIDMNELIQRYTDIIRQISLRINATENNINNDRRELDEILSRSKQMQYQLSDKEKDGLQQLINQMNKIGSMESSVSDFTNNQRKYERTSVEMTNEIHRLKSILNSQELELKSFTGQIHTDNEYQLAFDRIKRDFDLKQNNNDTGVKSITNPFEDRVNELRNVTGEMRRKQEDLIRERKVLQNSTTEKMNDLSYQVNEQNRSRDQLVQEMITAVNAQDYREDSERMKLTNRIGENIEMVKVKMLDFELKYRDDFSRRLMELEKTIVEEQELRRKNDRELTSEKELKWNGIRTIEAEDIREIKESRAADSSKFRISFKNLDSGISLLEQQILSLKNGFTSVLKSEIKSRDYRDLESESRFGRLDDKITAATVHLQASIAALSNELTESMSQMKTFTEKFFNDQKAEVKVQVDKLNDRILLQHNRLADVDEQLNQKLEDTSAKISASLRKKVESVTDWQGSVNNEFVELKNQNSALMIKAHEMEELLSLMKSELNSRATTETTSRVEDMDELRQALEVLKLSLPDKETLVPAGDVVKCLRDLEKMTDSLNKVKRVMAMKIQSEQRLRMEEVRLLQTEVNRLVSALEPFIHEYVGPRIFIKPKLSTRITRKQIESSTFSINKWSIYTAYRWLKWKSNILQLKKPQRLRYLQ